MRDLFTPREWSPRMARAILDLEKIRVAVPPALVQEPGDLFRIGETLAIMIVKIGHEVRPDQVWLYSDGTLVIGQQIRHLLEGRIRGFEHLAGRWPWPGQSGPPGSIPV